jgi:hypothetical protein
MQKTFVTFAAGVVLLLSSLPTGAVECKPVEVLLPESSDSIAFVKKAVKLALVDEEWSFNSETDHTVTATYGAENDSQQLTVLIWFDSKRVLISYLKSEARFDDPNMCDAPNAGPTLMSTIPGRIYNRWTSRLPVYILNNLQRVQILLN